jgi:hypothetical protein
MATFALAISDVFVSVVVEGAVEAVVGVLPFVLSLAFVPFEEVALSVKLAFWLLLGKHMTNRWTVCYGCLSMILLRFPHPRLQPVLFSSFHVSFAWGRVG